MSLTGTPVSGRQREGGAARRRDGGRSAAAACNGRLFGKQYEYEEDLISRSTAPRPSIVNASIPALVALRGLPLDPSPSAPPDRAKIRAAYESPVTKVTRVSPRGAARAAASSRSVSRPATSRSSARRRRCRGRATSSPRAAGTTSSSRTSGPPRCGRARCRTSAGTAARSSGSGCTCPAGSSGTTRAISRRTDRAARPRQHPRLGAASGRSAGRGPPDIKVEMDSQSILYRTLWLFGGAFAAALAVLAFSSGSR